MSDRICTTCGESKHETAEFFRPHQKSKGGLMAQCRACYNAKAKRRRAEAPEVYRAIKARHRATPKARTTDKSWRERSRALLRAKQARADAKRSADPSFRLKQRIKARIRQMALGKGGRSTEGIVGYTMEQLRAHLERQFTPGMSWDQLFAGEIHIDHIRPVALFDVKEIGDAEFMACWGLPNLRPMWALQNQKKGVAVETLL